MVAVSGLSNRSQRSVYNYARRPILRTGLRLVQLFLVVNLSTASKVTEISKISVIMYRDVRLF